MRGRRDREREFPHGARVRIEGDVGDDVTGSLRGSAAEVVGRNATYTHRAYGPMVNVRTEDGRMVAVPQAAVRRE